VNIFLNNPGTRSFELNDFLGKQRLLVLAPHSDDEVIGNGGLISKVKDQGGEVFVQVFTIGQLNHYDGTKESVEADTRFSEFRAVMDYFQVDDCEVVFRDDYRHLRLDQTPRRDLVDIIEKSGKLSIDHIRPTMVALPAPSYNQDHEALYRAALTACRPHLPEIKPFQKCVLVSDAPQLCWGDYRFRPNFYVDITGYLSKKLHAFTLHKSQQRADPHNGGVESLRFLAMKRGREISVEAAEAYHCLRFVL
jgi:LmbE family N-acetylglucosaminyl deacetylase